MFGIFGRSQDMQSLDRALRSAGLTPRGVPDAVKLTTLKQLKETNFGRSPNESAMAEAATSMLPAALFRIAGRLSKNF